MNDELPPPLVVRVPQACKLLACGHDTLYRLIREGKIESYREGGARKITVSSIKAYVEAQVAAGRRG